ncbi:MAG: hypothetical protein ACLP50_28120 [Solirubrobacteraceae bacterium]
MRSDNPAVRAEELAVLLKTLRSACSRGLAAIERQHQEAKRLARDAVRAIDGLELTVVADNQASGTSTTFRLHDHGRDGSWLLGELAAKGVTEIKPAADPTTVRWMHYDHQAQPERIRHVTEVLASAVAEANTSLPIADQATVL